MRKRNPAVVVAFALVALFVGWILHLALSAPEVSMRPPSDVRDDDDYMRPAIAEGDVASGEASPALNEPSPQRTADELTTPGSGAPDSVADAEPLTSSVVGSITDRADGTVLVDVLIELSSTSARFSRHRALTDRFGRYRIDGIPLATEFSVLVRRAGFRDYRGLPARTDSQASVIRHDLQLARQATVTGQVRDAAGRPIADAEIVLREESFPAPFQPPEERSSRIRPRTKLAITDSNGAYRALIDARFVSVQATADGFAPLRVGPFDARKQHQIAVDLELSNGPQLGGLVQDGLGRPVASARIVARFRASHPSEPYAAVTDDNGAFAIALVPAGAFDVEASRDGFARCTSPWKSGDPPLRLVLDAFGTVLIPVSSAEGAVGEAWVAATPIAADGRSIAEAREIVRGVALTDGAFRVDGLPAGRWRFLVGATSWAPIAIEDVAVVAGERTTVAAITPAAGVEVLGVVRDPSGAPIPDASVIATVPGFPSVHRSGGALFRAASSDAFGSFTLRGVPAGVASIEVRADDWRSPGPVTWEIPAQVVSTRVPDLELIAILTVRGTVRREGGGAAAGATISIKCGDRLFEGTAALSGEFMIRGIDVGEIAVSARSRDGALSVPWTRWTVARSPPPILDLVVR